MNKSFFTIPLVMIAVLVSIPYAHARADLFVGDDGGEMSSGHSGGIYIPTSYTGTLETYTMVVNNQKNFSITEVQVVLPQGMQLISDGNQKGWKVTVLEPPSVRTSVLIWNGSSILKGQSEHFVFKARNPSDVFVYYFLVVQTYEGGDNDVSRPWVQVISPTSIAGLEFSTVAGIVIVIVLVLPFIERAAVRGVKHTPLNANEAH